MQPDLIAAGPGEVYGSSPEDHAVGLASHEGWAS
jgi:hypothetical protein